MKVLYLAFTLLLMTARNCSKKAATAIVPVCIQQKIDAIRQQPKGNPAAEVYEYRYNGATVYYFSGSCCDQYNTVYDSSCRYVCAPSGGITGKGDRKCADFDSVAKRVRLVWKDER